MVAACGAGIAATESGRLRTLIWRGRARRPRVRDQVACAPALRPRDRRRLPGLRARLAAPAVGSLAAAGRGGARCRRRSLVAGGRPDARPRSARSSAAAALQLRARASSSATTASAAWSGSRAAPARRTRSRRTTSSRSCGPGSPRRRRPPRSATGPRTATPQAAAPPAAERHRARARAAQPVPFAGARSPLRIFGAALGGQAGWLVPLALAGLLAGARSRCGGRRDRRARAARRVRRVDGARADHPRLLGRHRAPLLRVRARARRRGDARRRRGRARRPGCAEAPPRGAHARHGARRARRSVATLAVELVLIGREHRPALVADPARSLLCAVALLAMPLRRRARPVGARRSRRARCSSPRSSSAPASGWRPSTGPSRPPGPTATPATAGSAVRAGGRARRPRARALPERRTARPAPYALLSESLGARRAADPARARRLLRGRLRRQRPRAQRGRGSPRSSPSTGRATCCSRGRSPCARATARSSPRDSSAPRSRRSSGAGACRRAASLLVDCAGPRQRPAPSVPLRPGVSCARTRRCATRSASRAPTDVNG